MNQTPSKNSSDHGLNGFMFGLTLGVLGALLLGTEEGRKITKQALEAIPENFKKIPNMEPKERIRDFTPPISTPEQTPHHAYVTPAFEAPPPPAPPSSYRPEYFSPGTK